MVESQLRMELENQAGDVEGIDRVGFSQVD